MSQTSLEDQCKAQGIPVKRGVKVLATHGEKRTMAQTGSDIWLYRWAKNSYRNYDLVSRGTGVTFLADTFKGLPSIVVGVGPSLDASIPALKEAVGRAIIISTDAAFRALMANDIRPDLVLSYDCKPEQALLWESVPAHGIPMLFDSCAHPDVIWSWRGPILFYNHWHQGDELSRLILPHVFPKIGQIPSGGTVGNSAALLAKILGCEPVIAVGMDFCYQAQTFIDPHPTKESAVTSWRYRARDYRHERVTDLQGIEIKGEWKPDEVKVLYDNDERIERSFPVTFKGVQYQMDPELQFYHENFITLSKAFKVPVINCSLDGALKDVFATMPLETAINRFCLEKPCFTVLDNLTSLAFDPRVK